MSASVAISSVMSTVDRRDIYDSNDDEPFRREYDLAHQFRYLGNGGDDRDGSALSSLRLLHCSSSDSAPVTVTNHVDKSGLCLKVRGLFPMPSDGAKLEFVHARLGARHDTTLTA